MLPYAMKLTESLRVQRFGGSLGIGKGNGITVLVIVTKLYDNYSFETVYMLVRQLKEYSSTN